jgi:hypothetical protein
MEAQYYLNLFKALLRKLKAEGFEGPVTCSIALVFLQELSKDRRVEEMKADREKERRKEPATVRQITYLKTLGFRIHDGISKQEASEVIRRILNE